MKKQISMVMLLVIIGTVLLSGCMNQSDGGDGTAPIDNKAKTVDPVSEGVDDIVQKDFEKEISNDIPNPKKAFGKIGFIGKQYLTDDVPPILVGSLDGFQIQDFRYEDGKFKFCIHDSKIRQDAILLTLSADQKTVHTISISTENGKTCYESSNLEDYLVNPKTIGIKEIKLGPMSKGIPAKKVSETVAVKTCEEIGFIGRKYSVDNFPPILVPSCAEKDLGKEWWIDKIQMSNFRYENSKIKFCIKNSGTRPYEKKVASASACFLYEHCDGVGGIEIVVPPNEIRCYEISTKYLEERRSKEIKFVAVSIR